MHTYEPGDKAWYVKGVDPANRHFGYPLTVPEDAMMVVKEDKGNIVIFVYHNPEDGQDYDLQLPKSTITYHPPFPFKAKINNLLGFKFANGCELHHDEIVYIMSLTDKNEDNIFLFSTLDGRLAGARIHKSYLTYPFETSTQLQLCNCPITVLMAVGCKCGGV